ncbi:MAG: hypothetical protein J7K72_03895 [Candidatus Aenigmarchaeota archaeon]|nr:hypothetical protein [Candidatus Aenigmarchaeota archaeon]
MERYQILLAKYQALISEWNAIFVSSSILFASGILGLVVGIVFYSYHAVFISIILMLIFATFEHKSRKIYIEAKEELEKEIFKGMKRTTARKLVDKGLIW